MKILLRILVLFLFISCRYENIESNYSNHNDAADDNLFQKGWIPKELVFESMENIYLQTNLDLNRCIFSYKISDYALELLQPLIIPTNQNFEKFHGIRFPNSWLNSVERSKMYKMPEIDVYLAIDDQKNMIYGWRK